MSSSTGLGDAFAIEAQDLVMTYRPGARVLDGLTFGVGIGAVSAMLGPRGAGKSTAIRILSTAAQPDVGRAWVAGHEVGLEPDAVRRRIGCVGQLSGIDRAATGRENLLRAGRWHGVKAQVLRARVGELLDRFGLADVARSAARTYSEVMRRKLDLALALVHDPAVLLLDDPTAGLDPHARTQLWAQIGWQSRQEGRTVLLATHDLDEADQVASELVIVDRGRVVAHGSPETLKADLRIDRPSLTDVYLRHTGRWHGTRASLGAGYEARVAAGDQGAPGGPGRAAGSVTSAASRSLSRSSSGR